MTGFNSLIYLLGIVEKDKEEQKKKKKPEKEENPKGNNKPT